MTTTETTTTETFDVNGNLFRLDSLVEAYQEILEQAKAQLEAFEPTDDQFLKIGRGLADHIDYRSLAIRLEGDMVGDPYTSYSGRALLDRVVQRVQERIDERVIRRLIRQELDQLVTERFESLQRTMEINLETLLNRDVRSKVDRARDIQHAVDELMGAGVLTLIRSHIDEQISKQLATQQQG